MFVLRSPAEKCATTLECVSLESDLTIARFDMTECEVKTDKDTLVLQMPNAVPVILQPPADEYERWKHVLRQVWFVEVPTTTFCQSCSFLRIPPFFTSPLGIRKIYFSPCQCSLARVNNCYILHWKISSVKWGSGGVSPCSANTCLQN